MVSIVYSIFLLLIMLTREVPSASSECRFPAVFNFGDSNSDTGGLDTAFPPLSPPFGMTFFKTPAGRYSDGRLAIDFIVEAFGYSYLSPYLQSVGSNFYRGANFASAGSSVLRPTSSFFSSGISPFYIEVQLGHFQEFKKRVTYNSQGSPNSLPEKSFFDEALYIIEMGQNDFSHNIGLLGFEGIKSILPQVVDGISNGIKFLYGTGARNMLVMNIGPLGCYPSVLYYYGSSSTLDGSGCIATINDGVSYFNTLLKTKVGEIQQELFGSSIIYVDSFSIKYDLISNYSLHGFSQAFQACCGGGGNYNFDPKIPCGSSTGSCPDPSTHISWDGVHFTEAAHKHIATKILSGGYFSPSFQLC